ncbi:hypothetical protein ACH4UT_28360 [Streptomyces sp. NPDC020799]|uniref:hypothetical protein n=1 Tax=Streptomyces sp. NPDC020799 TaxID=3365091 RepID=UPI0037AFCDC0
MSRKNPEKYPAVAAEEIRKFNHATLIRTAGGGLRYPGQAYHAVADLKALTQRLPQSFDQISTALANLSDHGHLTADFGQVEDHVAEARSALASAAMVAVTLSEFLDHAHSAVSPLGYSGPLPDTDDE